MPQEISDGETPKRVLDLNFEVKFFNDKLKSHLNVNVVDLQLLNQLQETTDLISKLLNGCTLIETETINVAENLLPFQPHRQLYCEPCNKALKVDINRIIEHTTSSKHRQYMEKTESKKPKQVNTQVFTNSKVQSEKAVVNQAQVVDNNSVLPKSTERKEKPEKQKENRKNSESECKKLSKRVLTFLRDYSLDGCANRLVIQGEQTRTSLKHQIVIQSIIDSLRPGYPNVKVFAFGSRVTGLGTKESDLDLFVDLSKYLKKLHKFE